MFICCREFARFLNSYFVFCVQYDTTFEPNYYDDDDESQDSKGALEEEINADLDDGDDDFASLRKQSCWSRACSSVRKYHTLLQHIV